MADDNLSDGSLSVPDPNALDQMGPLPQVSVLSQYVKDLSFENPNAPQSLQWNEAPRIDVNVGVNARRGGDDVFEVELKITARAEVNEQTAFVIDLLYGALFGLANVPEEALEPFLIIEAPRIIFPFARRIVADAVRDGGFPPLMLDPIDFAALYMAQQQAGGATAGNA
ncbi:preprotein translocase subunit SecB [alpha proteobacterium AAP81b]|nr:preprotein translocase subunit SecB [alpha proteobacterium AAP81b]